ncbi:hypothetical protein DFP72DRAFT_1052141 [Ephemerocybe angulata]|uniref:Uncharacterized protein n=1 Tax=Ephemerocybe angulata TaxID=980116 RepID=A0A8H6HEM2_9AGAR|nr:hypothetical protein DFP72DRAFT_1052141 [Tulosesus angulatus]
MSTPAIHDCHDLDEIVDGNEHSSFVDLSLTEDLVSGDTVSSSTPLFEASSIDQPLRSSSPFPCGSRSSENTGTHGAGTKGSDGLETVTTTEASPPALRPDSKTRPPLGDVTATILGSPIQVTSRPWLSTAQRHEVKKKVVAFGGPLPPAPRRNRVKCTTPPAGSSHPRSPKRAAPGASVVKVHANARKRKRSTELGSGGKKPVRTPPRPTGLLPYDLTTTPPPRPLHARSPIKVTAGDLIGLFSPDVPKPARRPDELPDRSKIIWPMSGRRLDFMSYARSTGLDLSSSGDVEVAVTSTAFRTATRPVSKEPFAPVAPDHPVFDHEGHLNPRDYRFWVCKSVIRSIICKEPRVHVLDLAGHLEAPVIHRNKGSVKFWTMPCCGRGTLDSKQAIHDHAKACAKVPNCVRAGLQQHEDTEEYKQADRDLVAEILIGNGLERLLLKWLSRHS